MAGGEHFLAPKNPILKKIAAEELNETSTRIIESLEYIKEWLSKQPHINPRLDDEFLIGFLRSSKYSLETAKNKLDTYFSFRTLASEFYRDRVPLDPNILKLMEIGTYVFLPVTHPDGSGISVTRLANINEVGSNIIDLLRMITMINDKIGIYNEHLTIAGTHAIIDVEGFTLTTATQVLQIASKLTLGIENAYPIRIKYFHVYNIDKTPPIFQMVLKTIRALFREKMAKKILIHDSLEELQKAVPKHLLPKEYGGDSGTLPEIADKNVTPIIVKSAEWFKDDIQYKSDESKRVGQTKKNEMFGVEGSFKKLEID